MWDGLSGFCHPKLVSGCFLCLLRTRAAKLSLSFPRPFLTPFLAVSSPCLYANHNILKDSRRGCRVLASLCCFSPACPCPPVPAIGAGAVTGGHRDSESWEGWDLSSKQPRNDEDLTKQLLWLSQSLPGHGRAVDAPISIPAGSKSLSKHPLGIAWALFASGVLFFSVAVSGMRGMTGKS